MRANSVMRVRAKAILGTLVLGLGACGGDGADPPGTEPLGGSLTVSGVVVDFVTGMPVEGSASVSTSGLAPLPTVSAMGPSFEITGVPENSTFHVLAASPPSHRATIGPAVTVIASDLENLELPVLSEAYAGDLAAAFGVTPAASDGILLARVVDAQGAPRAGVSAQSFQVGNGGAVEGPFFLDENRQAAPGLNATSASGYVVFFALSPGLTGVTATDGSGLTLDMPLSPVVAGAVTLADVAVIEAAPGVPVNVSFANDVVPIFTSRGCVACHSGGGIGKDLGGLMLDAGLNKTYMELVEERPGRVNLVTPEASYLLTLPSREDPADRHPNVTFASALDPDYLILLGWIQQGAPMN